MGMILELHSVSDNNIKKILEQPALIWKLVEPDDPGYYEEAVKNNNKVGFLSKFFGKKAVSEIDLRDLEFVEGENASEDLDKAWQGIHYCLNKTAYDAPPPMDFITRGGIVAGKVEIGYGPARLFDSKLVNEIHQNILKISEAEITANYNPEEMVKLDIYPNVWEHNDDGLNYVVEKYLVLKEFIEHCNSHCLGMAMYLG